MGWSERRSMPPFDPSSSCSIRWSWVMIAGNAPASSPVDRRGTKSVVEPYAFRVGERTILLPAAQEHILAQENGKERCLLAVRALSEAFALAVPHEDAIRIRDDVAFFQAFRLVLAKRAVGEACAEEELDMAIRQIVSRAVAWEGVVHVFAAVGLEKPDISILSEEFLAEVRRMNRRNLVVDCCGSCSWENSRFASERTWSKRGPSPKCSLRPSAATEPGHRGRTDHRGTDSTCPRDARSELLGRGLGTLRGRTLAF